MRKGVVHSIRFFSFSATVTVGRKEPGHALKCAIHVPHLNVSSSCQRVVVARNRLRDGQIPGRSEVPDTLQVLTSIGVSIEISTCISRLGLKSVFCCVHFSTDGQQQDMKDNRSLPW